MWLNCYHAYPAHAPFGGYKQSGFGRETHKMMLAHYRQVRACKYLPVSPNHPHNMPLLPRRRQTKNILTSYDQNKLGFF